MLVSVTNICDIAASLAACLVSLYCAVAGLVGGVLALFLYIQRETDKARRVSVALWPLVAFPSVSAFLSLLVAVYVGGDTPDGHTKKSGCLSKKFFLKIFFIFAFVIEVFKPVGVVSSFAGFFCVEYPKIVYFLDVAVVVGWENAKFGYFWAFLDAFASCMRGYMFYIEKTPKKGLFWVSLFLVICHCSDW